MTTTQIHGTVEDLRDFPHAKNLSGGTKQNGSPLQVELSKESSAVWMMFASG